MTAPLSADLADKLCKVLGMLGSAHVGERAAAGMLATRLLQDAGLTWPDVLRPPTPPRWLPQRDPRDLARQCSRFPEVLTDWETGFLAEIAGRPRPPSARQIRVLHEIAERARVYAEVMA